MRSFSELEELWSQKVAQPRDRGEVVLIVARVAKGVHEELQRGKVTLEEGLVGDRWVHGRDGKPPEIGRQLTLMNVDVARWLTGDDIPLHTPGDNFLVDFDVGEASMPAGKKFRMGEAVIVVSELPHTGCKKFKHRFGEDALRWISDKSHRERRLRGLNCTVVEPGYVAVGDSIVPV